MKTIKKIVFTGGPCSGKTTFMSRAEEIFGERGYRVIVDNESATDLISGGISPATPMSRTPTSMQAVWVRLPVYPSGSRRCTMLPVCSITWSTDTKARAPRLTATSQRIW